MVFITVNTGVTAVIMSTVNVPLLLIVTNAYLATMELVISATIIVHPPVLSVLAVKIVQNALLENMEKHANMTAQQHVKMEHVIKKVGTAQKGASQDNFLVYMIGACHAQVGVSLVQVMTIVLLAQGLITGDQRVNMIVQAAMKFAI